MKVARCLLGWPCSVFPTALPGPGKWDRPGLSRAFSSQVLEHEVPVPSCCSQEVTSGKGDMEDTQVQCFCAQGCQDVNLLSLCLRIAMPFRLSVG